jgi:hypothetical protein
VEAVEEVEDQRDGDQEDDDLERDRHLRRSRARCLR